MSDPDGPKALEAHATVKVPQSFWNRPLKADFRQIFKSLGKAVAHGLVGKYEDLVADASEAATAIGINTPPEELAGVLLHRSLHRAIAALLSEAKDLFEGDRQADSIERNSGEYAEKALSSVDVTLGDSFFERPGDLQIVKELETFLKGWLVTLGLKPAQARGLASRLPSFVTYALNEEWRKYQSTYQPLKEFLATPFAAATEREHLWREYIAFLQRQANQRMFDEAFSLKQVYVRLRAYIEKKVTTKDPHSRWAERHRRVQQAVWLDKALVKWLKEQDSEDSLRILSGGPGSGKSSFARLFAAEIAQNGITKVVYIPLHRLQLSEDLTKAIHEFCSVEDRLPPSILDSKSGESRVFLIFDGLDELEKQGKMAAQVASGFIQQVERLLLRSNTQCCRVQVLICGRPVAVQAAESMLRREQQILHLLPYYLTPDERKTYQDPDEILEEDQRDEWWRRYGECIDKPYKKMPQELSRSARDLTEITAQPLLNYLLALSYDRKKVDFSSTVNLNNIYYDLLDAVYNRGYEKTRSRTVQGIAFVDFVRVLEEIGLATWHGDGRTATIQRINNRCQSTRSVSRALEQFSKDAESGITRLLAAFYFREHGQVDGDKTFEFTHKSFGEYLTARRIVRELRSIHDACEKLDNGDETGIDEKAALSRWIDVCGPSEITHELYRFVRQEIGTYDGGVTIGWQSTCVKLIDYIMVHQMPMGVAGLSTYRSMDLQAHNAEESLLATHCACAWANERVSQIRWPSQTAFGSWVRRLTPQRDAIEWRVALVSLAWIDIRGQLIYALDGHGAVLAHIDGENIKAAYGQFLDAKLPFAQLQGGDFHRACFRRADLRGADFSEAKLEGADFEGANLVGAIFRGARMQGVNMRKAYLDGAIFDGAVMESADLSGADVDGISIVGTVFRGAKSDNEKIDAAISAERSQDSQLIDDPNGSDRSSAS